VSGYESSKRKAGAAKKKQEPQKRRPEYLFCGLCPHFTSAHGPRGCKAFGCECKKKGND